MPAHLPSAVILLGMLVMFAMAYAEGANDVSKGVATLVGSGLTSYRRAIGFGTVWNALGALAAIMLAQEVAVTLTKGLIAPTAPVSEAFALAALVGAMGWILLATRLAMPVSGSHAIVGSIIILGAFVFGADAVRWDAVWERVVVPMVGSPLMAIPLGLVLYLILAPLAQRFSLASAHWLSAAATSFARGLNDAPKMVALGAFFYLANGGDWSLVPAIPLFVIVAAGMTLGSLVAGRRVTETLAERVTTMDHAEGLAANATTALLVIWASRLGLPTSITYVIGSSVVAMGIRRAIQDVSWRTVSRMASAWLVTLPVSGVLAGLSYLLLVRLLAL